MDKPLSYGLGRLVARVPGVVWAGAALLALVAVSLNWGGSAPTSPGRAAEAVPAASDPVVVKCQSERAAMVAAYQSLVKSDPWQASTSIRLCADRLQDKEMQAMVAAAEKADLEKTLQNAKAFPDVRLDALEKLTALGQPLTPERAKLKEDLARKVAQNEALLAKSAKARKKAEGVRVGDSMQDAIDSSWGKPERINRTQSAYGTREQWVYGNGNYLYFRDGVLESIQTSR